MTNRDATASMNGYNYQRLYALYLMTENYNNENINIIKEEGDEDIDIILNNGNKELTQVKYHSCKNEKTSEYETLKQNSGIFKVIRSHIDNNNKINKINMYVYNKHIDSYSKIIKSWEDDVKDNNDEGIINLIYIYFLYYVKSLCNKNCKDDCSHSVLNKLKLDKNKLSDEDKQTINITIEKMFPLYLNNGKIKDEYIIFFKKFSFYEGLKPSELFQNVNNNLKKIFIDGQQNINEFEIDLKIDLLRCKMIDCMNKNGFDGNKNLIMKKFLNEIKEETQKVLIYKNDMLIKMFYDTYSNEMNNVNNDKDYIHNIFFKTIKYSIENLIETNASSGSKNNIDIKTHLYKLYELRTNSSIIDKKQEEINIMISYIYLYTYICKKDVLLNSYTCLVKIIDHLHRVVRKDEKSIKKNYPSQSIEEIINNFFEIENNEKKPKKRK